MKDSCGHGIPAPPNLCWPAGDSRDGPVDSIAALTLPSVARQRQRASPLIVDVVDDLTLPYHDRRCGVIRNPQATLVPQRCLWMLGHAFLLLGVFVLATVGGVWADAQAQIAAAQGDAAVPALVDSTTRPAASPVIHVTPTERPTFAPGPPPPPSPMPIVTGGSAPDPPIDPAATPRDERSTITRLVISAIHLDKKVVEVGWSTEEIAGQAVTVWEVDRYRVGHHHGSSNPGGGSNIVLAGHSGGSAYPFNDLFYVKPGDLIEIYSARQRYQYMVTEHHLVDEVDQPLAKRLENARYMEPTDDEVVTMIACWPLAGPKKFTQRVIIRATPIQIPTNDQGLSPTQPR